MEHPDIDYHLKWTAQGKSFFDQFDFITNDSNNGATHLLNRQDAQRLKLTEAFDTHAILRSGPKSETQQYKRTGVKIGTKRSFTYYLMIVELTHVPWGCGVWPAVWTRAPRSKWPDGGELDIVEYVHDFPGQTSFHTGRPNRCKLDGTLLNVPGCPVMPDINGMNYDCNTTYPNSLGCAVNTLPLYNGLMWAQNPSVIAVEWTPSFLKVFRIPIGDIPADLRGDKPKPDTWDKWVIAYYPFAASEERSPGSCPNPAQVLQPQQLVMNIGFCGDWASKVWDMAGTCVNRVGPAFPSECKSVDPLFTHDPEHDCCTQFITDPEDRYGTAAYLQEHAYFNISSVKVFQWVGRRAAGQAAEVAGDGDRWV